MRNRTSSSSRAVDGRSLRAGKLLAGLKTRQSAQRKSGNRRHESRRVLGLPEAALALHSGTAVAWDLPTTTGATGGNPEAGRRGAKAWHPDGAGSIHSASGDAGFHLFISLIRHLLLLTVHGVQRTPQRIQRLIRGLQNLFLVAARMLFQPAAPRRTVRLVRFLVHLKIRQAVWLRHAVKSLQSINLRRGDLRHLRFISVERRHRFRHRPVSANLPEFLHHGLRSRQSRAAGNVVLTYSHGRRKIPPELRVLSGGTLLLRQVLTD